MAKREEMRNLETIPVGSLGIIALKGCQELGEKVDQYLVDWRTERENEHKDSLHSRGISEALTCCRQKYHVLDPVKQRALF